MIRVSELIKSCAVYDQLKRIAIIDHGDLFTIPAQSDLWNQFNLRVVKSWLLSEKTLFIELKGETKK